MKEKNYLLFSVLSKLNNRQKLLPWISSEGKSDKPITILTLVIRNLVSLPLTEALVISYLCGRKLRIGQAKY